VGRVPGYEIRFYSHKKNKIIGGTPGDVYKIPINYKYHFDAFRHKMVEKSVMYTFPGMAGQQDLKRTERILLKSDKKVLFTYLGGMDGAQHILGKRRSKNFMIFVDRFIKRMKKRYHKVHEEPLEIVLFSDHGFHYDKLHSMRGSWIKKALKDVGLKLKTKLEDKNDVVLVKFGLLSAGVMFTDDSNKKTVSEAIHNIKGIDLVFWTDSKRIHIINSRGERAYFEYACVSNRSFSKKPHIRSPCRPERPKKYRYVTLQGDPLNYLPQMRKKGYKAGQWISDRAWFRLTSLNQYPDAGCRLFDSFYTLVQNGADVMFSLEPNYQFGSIAALIGTRLKFRHKGTHGGLFNDVSSGMVMSDTREINRRHGIRYDEMFPLLLPHVTRAYKKELRRELKSKRKEMTESHSY